MTKGSGGYDMSTFIRRYGRYLNERAFAYRQMAFDFTKVKKGAEGVMRTMTPEKLLKGMPVLQTQIDTLLEFDVHPKELNNPIINAGFLLLFKDLTVGVDKNDIPDINYAPSSILESLETHMNSLEGKKGSPTKGSPTNNVSPTSTPAKSAAAVPTLAPPPEEATDSLLDLDPLSSSGPSVGASAAPTSWGEMGESMLPDPTLAVDPAPSPAGCNIHPCSCGARMRPPPPPPARRIWICWEMHFRPLFPPLMPLLMGGAPTSTPTPAADAAADPFAPSGCSSDAVYPGLDLFAVMPMENKCFNSVAPPSCPLIHHHSTIPPTTPSIDLFSAMFDSMPDTSFTKADPAPSVDMFGAGRCLSPPVPPSFLHPPTDKGVIMDMFGV
ncbi:unnamed protein product, partial [Coregonus sp. 'balchen']